ncbi:hypothetical protein [Sphingobacterium sp.]|uniref:hypothetical protein n=1 Tax=Sphingobacterium sp. TaxID=341027 RepID=UPI0039172DBE
MDPLAEDYESTTPYAYVENNPIGYIDPTGMYKVDANGNITIDDRDEIENFVRFLNSNQGATYKDVATEVFSAGRGYSNQLNEVSVIGHTAYNNGSGVRSLETRQAGLVTGAFALGELSGGGAIGLGISGLALNATGIGVAFVRLTYASFKVNEAGYPVDVRPYSQSVLGFPSLSETNGMLFSKKSGEEKASDVPSWARGKKPLSGVSGKDFAKRLWDEQYGEGTWSGTGPESEFSKFRKSGDRNK